LILLQRTAGPYIGVNRVAGDPASRSADFRSTRES
jgi:hypothetical protein